MNNWQIKHCFQFWNLEYPALCTRFKIERRKRFLLFYPGSRVSFWFLITRKSTINKIGSFDQCRGEQRCLKFIPMPFYSHFCCQGFPTAQCVVIVLQIYSVLSFTMDDEDYERLCVVCFVSGLSGFLACSYEYYKVSISLRRNRKKHRRRVLQSRFLLMTTRNNKMAFHFFVCFLFVMILSLEESSSSINE